MLSLLTRTCSWFLLILKYVFGLLRHKYSTLIVDKLLPFLYHNRTRRFLDGTDCMEIPWQKRPFLPFSYIMERSDICWGCLMVILDRIKRLATLTQNSFICRAPLWRWDISDCCDNLYSFPFTDKLSRLMLRDTAHFQQHPWPLPFLRLRTISRQEEFFPRSEKAAIKVFKPWSCLLPANLINNHWVGYITFRIISNTLNKLIFHPFFNLMAIYDGLSNQ